MITTQFFEIINKIDRNLKNRFWDITETHLERILSRLSKLTEEVWELNSDILDKYYKKHKFSSENLEWEFADVFITLALLAKSLEVDINEALTKKFTIIEKRWGV